jgi:hypothetical protein
MSNTYYHPILWQIRDPTYYTQVPWEKLRVNHWYAFEMGHNLFSGVKILENNNDLIRFECYDKVYTIVKHDPSNTPRRINGFYEKNNYHNRKSYRELSEGLDIVPNVRRQPPNIQYLLNPEIEKEISSYLGPKEPNGGKRQKIKTKQNRISKNKTKKIKQNPKKIKRKNKT